MTSSEDLKDPKPPPAKPIKEIIFKEFHPIWFLSFMGSGIAASILYNFPYPAYWLRICGYIMWAISLSLFLLTTSMFIGKLVLYPETLAIMFTDPNIVVFFGAYSMGWSTVVNMTHLISDGHWAIGVWCFWWINVVLLLGSGWFLVFILMTKSKIPEQTIQGTLILPVLPLTVSAASGSLIVTNLPTPLLQKITIVISFMLWSNSLSLGFCIIAIYFWRLFIYKIPEKPAMFTSWVPLGLLAQGSWGILNNGLNTKRYILLYSQYENKVILGDIAHSVTFAITLFLISFGIFFTLLLTWTCIYRGKTNFSRTWWAMPFPIGAMSICCNEFRLSFPGFDAFRILASIYGIVCICAVITCLLGSLIYETPRELGPVWR